LGIAGPAEARHDSRMWWVLGHVFGGAIRFAIITGLLLLSAGY
jgi:hypothetical protein